MFQCSSFEASKIFYKVLDLKISLKNFNFFQAYSLYFLSKIDQIISMFFGRLGQKIPNLMFQCSSIEARKLFFKVLDLKVSLKNFHFFQAYSLYFLSKIDQIILGLFLGV